MPQLKSPDMKSDRSLYRSCCEATLEICQGRLWLLFRISLSSTLTSFGPLDRCGFGSSLPTPGNRNADLRDRFDAAVRGVWKR